MEISDLQNTIEMSIKSGRLANSIFSIETISEGIFTYRIEDDIVLDEFSKILREHIIIGIFIDDLNWDVDITKLITDNWIYRYGVGSITVVSYGKIPLQIENLLKQMPLYFIKYKADIPQDIALFPLPFDNFANSREINNYSIISENSETYLSMRFNIDIFLETFKFLITMYKDETPIIDHKMTYDDRKNKIPNSIIHSSEGGYDISQYIGNDGYYHYYYQYYRGEIERKRIYSIFLIQRLQVEDNERNRWLIELLLKTLWLVLEYCNELLYSTNILEVVNKLNEALNNLRKKDSIELLLKQLNSSSLLNSLHFLEMLGDFRASGAIEMLSEMLSSPEKEIRRWTVQTMSCLRDPSVIQYLEPALKDQNNLVRQNAIEGLGIIGGDKAAQVLSCYLNQCASEEKEMVMSALADTKSLIGFERLLRELLSEDTANLQSLSWLIARFFENRCNIDSVRYEWESSPIQKKTLVLKSMLDIINRRENTEKMKGCIKVLAVLRESSAVPYLLSILQNDNDDLDYTTIETLEEIGGDDVTKGLVEILRVQREKVNWKLISAIGKLKVREAIPLLIDLVKAKKHVRVAIKAIGEIGDKEAIHEIKNVIAQDKNFASQAATALAQIEEEFSSEPSISQKPSLNELTLSIRDRYIRYNNMHKGVRKLLISTKSEK